MRLIVLGSGSCAPTARRGSSGLLLEAAGRLILLDGGAGVVEKMARTGLFYGDLDAVFYTHEHADHTAGIIPLLFALNYTPGFERTRPLPVFGPGGTADLLRRAMAFGRAVAPKGYEVPVTELRPGATGAVEGVRFRAEAMCHAGLPALGYRFEAEGISLAYSGDTEECDGLAALAEGVDLLILECSYPAGTPLTGHLDAAACGRVARGAGARRLLLVHMYEACDSVDIVAQVREEYDGEVILGEDLLEVAL